MIRTFKQTKPVEEAPQQGFWEGKLGYAHSWLVVMTALCLGMTLHLVSGPAPSHPIVLAVFGLPLIASAVFVRVKRHSETAHWLAGIPLAVTSTGLALFLALLGGVLPSKVWNGIGLPSPWASWPFLMVSLVVASNLSAAVAKRAWPLTRQNTLFMLSHLGLLICMAGGAMSSIFIERCRIAVFPDVALNKAQTPEGKDVVLPFAFRLKEFTMENFPPTLAVAHSAEDIKSGSHYSLKGMKESIRGLDIEVLQHVDKAIFDGKTYKAIPWKTAAPASLIRVSRDGKKLAEGWVTSGSIDVPAALLPVTEGEVVVMNAPKPKKFHSALELTEGKSTRALNLEVNSPASVADWQVYQVSYDEELGAASQYSVIELVRDRGVPVVYLGMILVVLAACWHLWEGVGVKK